MDFTQNGSLTIIEQLFEEFYNPYTSNIRKHEIEEQLGAIKNTPHLCELCLYFLSHTTSQYVIMFALQTMETVITQHWANVPWPKQEEIKLIIQTNLLHKSCSLPNFLKTKYAKLLIDIAKHDWPHRYPNFFDTILELLRSTDELDQLNGLTLLKMTCEEFVGANVQFDNRIRHKEITRLLQNYIPMVFYLLTNILDKLASNSNKAIKACTATPPPSPTHAASAAAQPINSHQLETSATLAANHKTLKIMALNTMQYMFGWVPVEDIPFGLLKAIFGFTYNSSAYVQDNNDHDICISAISAINEIFYRKCCPPGSEMFFKDIYMCGIEMVKNALNSLSSDAIFVDKVTELLILLIEQHFWRFEKDPSHSSLDFLSIFFQYTMQLHTIDCYLKCLKVWMVFFKQIKDEHVHKYTEVFLGLGSALVKKVQFTYNADQLKHVDCTELDEDNKTEWQYFIEGSTDVMSRTAQQTPVEVFNQVLSHWNEAHNVYRQLGSLVDHHNRVLNLERTETEKVCYILKDYATLTYILSGLAHHFYPNDNDCLKIDATSMIFMLVDNILQSASQAKQIRFDTLKVSDASLQACFVEVHSELLASLKTWLKWLENHSHSSTSGISIENVEVFLDITLPLLSTDVKIDRKITNAAAHLFLELARKPSNSILSHDIVISFIRNAATTVYSDSDTRDTVNSAICDIILRTMKNSTIPSSSSSSDDIVNKKLTLFQEYCDILTKAFRLLRPETSEFRIQEIVSHTLPMLSHIVEYCRGFSVVAKKALAVAVKPTLDHALLLFPTYVKFKEVHNYFAKFFITVLKNLQPQIGVQFTRNAIQIFLQVAISEQQANNLCGLQQLLEIFTVIVRDCGNNNFLPDILQMCMDNVYPLVIQQIHPHPDVCVTFLDLLHSILNFRWQYFYNSQVMMGYSPGGSDTESGPDLPKRPEQLLAVLKVFGEALLQDDLNVFRKSLVVLQDLNRSKRLFHKGIFRTHLLQDLLKVLLNTLLYKRQGISCEDIVLGIYAMAEVDFDGFFTTFLPHFIRTLVDGGITMQQCELLLGNFHPTNDRDVPSFLQHLQNFATDFQHFRMMSSNSVTYGSM